MMLILTVFQRESGKMASELPLATFQVRQSHIPRKAIISSLQPLASLLVLLVISYVLFFRGLADRDLWSSHEARAAQDAQTMLEDHQWGLPRLYDRKIELQKPPLYYWLVAGIGWLRGGVDGWAVRLPASISALACMLLVFGFCSTRGRRLAGFLAACALATMVHYTWLARVGRIDMPLAFCVALQLMGLYLHAVGIAPTRWLWLVPVYVAAATAVLLKGPIGVVLAGAVWATHLLLNRWLKIRNGRSGERREIDAERNTAHGLWRWTGSRWLNANYGLWWGLPLVILLTMPWFLWANHQTNGDLFRVFFLKHNLERGLGELGDGGRGESGEGDATDSDLLASPSSASRLHHHWHPWWFYFPRLMFDALPWTIVLPVFLYFGVRRRWLWPWLRLDGDAGFGLIWLVTILILLSCVRFKRSDYLLPAYPGLALFLGCMGEHWLRNPKSQSGGARAAEGRGRGATNKARGYLLPLRFASRFATPRLWQPLPLRRDLAFAKIVSLSAIVICMIAGWCVYVSKVLPSQEVRLEATAFAKEIRLRSPVGSAELGSAPVIFFRTEAHDLAFHVGRPLDTILEWENLDIWASRPGVYYVIMPPEVALEWPQHLKMGRLVEVMRNTDLSGGSHAHPLVLLRTQNVERRTQESGVSRQ